MNPGLHRLHKAGWVHRDFSPGNVIVAGTRAMISDLEFANRRVAGQLEELTRPNDTPLPDVREMRMVGLSLARVHASWTEVVVFRELHISQPSRSSTGNTCFFHKISRTREVAAQEPNPMRIGTI